MLYNQLWRSAGCTEEPGLLLYVPVLCAYNSIPQELSTKQNAHLWTGTVPHSGGTQPTHERVQRDEFSSSPSTGESHSFFSVDFFCALTPRVGLLSSKGALTPPDANNQPGPYTKEGPHPGLGLEGRQKRAICLLIAEKALPFFLRHGDLFPDAVVLLKKGLRHPEN
jgi:hypothetical protein